MNDKAFVPFIMISQFEYEWMPWQHQHSLFIFIVIMPVCKTLSGYHVDRRCVYEPKTWREVSFGNEDGHVCANGWLVFGLLWTPISFSVAFSASRNIIFLFSFTEWNCQLKYWRKRNFRQKNCRCSWKMESWQTLMWYWLQSDSKSQKASIDEFNRWKKRAIPSSKRNFMQIFNFI